MESYTKGDDGTQHGGRRSADRKRGRNPPGPWHFWRGEFWTRPALLFIYGIAAATVAVTLAVLLPGTVRDAVAMQTAHPCPTSPPRPKAHVDPPEGCLERASVVLSGPRHSRGPGSGWSLLVSWQGQSTVFATARVPTLGSRQLDRGDQVYALLWEGKPVMIESPTGARIETSDWGYQRPLFFLTVALFCGAAALLLLTDARIKRRRTSSWWSTRGGKVHPRDWYRNASRPLRTAMVSVALPTFLIGSAMLLTAFGVGVVPALVTPAATISVLATAGQVMGRRAASAGRPGWPYRSGPAVTDEDRPLNTDTRAPTQNP